MPGPQKDALFVSLYDTLREIAAGKMKRERQGHTLEPTSLVNELWLQLDGQTRAQWNSETQFRALAANLMDRLLREYGRKSKAQKRGGEFVRVSFDDGIAIVPGREEEVDALCEALGDLRELDPGLAQVVDYAFVGLTQPEIAGLLGVSERKVRKDWAWARSWLRTRMSASPADGA